MLTRKQYDLLMFIHTRIRETGVSPSFDEMKDALNLKSKSGIHRLITALEERAYVRRLPHRARALEVLKLPENIAGGRQPHSGGATTSGAQAGGAPHLSLLTGGEAPTPIGRPLTERSSQGGRGVRPIGAQFQGGSEEVPLIGRIAAGTPIEALQSTIDHVGVPSLMLTSGSEHFALEVKGDSMIEAGIHDGDLVVIRRQDHAQNGDIVVALVDDIEATLKRLRKSGGASIALEPANADFETRVYGADQVKIQGKLVGLIRSY